MDNALALRDQSLALRPKYPVSRRVQRETVTFRNAQIIYRNFSGKPTPFNPEGGERAFSVLLDEELAKSLLDRGMNIKPVKMREDDEEQMYQLPVAVSYKIRPPRVYMVTGDGDVMPLRKTMLPEELVEMMDNLDLGEAHLVVALSNYDVRGSKGKKAYLQSFFGHVMLDELEQEYATVEDMVADDTQTHHEADSTILEGEWSEA
jgi:hypothetical protein